MARGRAAAKWGGGKGIGKRGTDMAKGTKKVGKGGVDESVGKRVRL